MNTIDSVKAKKICVDIAVAKIGSFKKEYELYGKGFWLLYGKNNKDIENVDPSKAVFVPLRSMNMFFDDKGIHEEVSNINMENQLYTLIFYDYIHVDDDLTFKGMYRQGMTITICMASQ